MINPRNFKGTRDFLPTEMLRRNEVFNIVQKTFEQYGFEPLQTPAIEFYDILTDKYGDDEKLIYKLNYGDGNELALRYDLTVPLSRVVAQNQNLLMPFKRYQMQPVWRADSPQPKQGRFREFYQCDIDVVGSKSIMADAELIATALKTLDNLGLTESKIIISNRKLIKWMAQSGDEKKLAIILDKSAKIGFENTEKELDKNGFGNNEILKYYFGLMTSNMSEIYKRDKLYGGATRSKIEQSLNWNYGYEASIELYDLFGALKAMGISDDRLFLDFTLARGMDYYTGNIFEIKLDGYPSSIGGGGRYDNIIGNMTGRNLPAVGISLGIERIIDILKNDPKYRSTTQFYVACFKETELHTLRIAEYLRTLGYNVAMTYEPEKISNQISYASSKNIKYIVMPFEKELSEGYIVVKDLEQKKQVCLREEEFADFENKIKLYMSA